METHTDEGQPPGKRSPARRKANLPRGATADPDLLAETIALKRAQKEKVEIANAKLRGELLPADDVRAEWTQACLDIRNALLAVPARLPQLSEKDRAAVDREIRAALSALAEEDEDLVG